MVIGLTPVNALNIARTSFELCLSGSCLTRLIDGRQPQELHYHDPDVRNQIDHRIYVYGGAEDEDHNLQEGKSVVIVHDGTVFLRHHTLAGPSTIYLVVFPVGTMADEAQ